MKINIYLPLAMLIFCLLPIQAFSQGPEGFFMAQESTGALEEYLGGATDTFSKTNEKLSDIQEKVQFVQEQFRADKISEDQARKQLRSLAEQEIAIFEDHDFKVESRVNMAIFSSKNQKQSLNKKRP